MASVLPLTTAHATALLAIRSPTQLLRTLLGLVQAANRSSSINCSHCRAPVGGVALFVCRVAKARVGESGSGKGIYICICVKAMVAGKISRSERQIVQAWAEY